MRHSVTDGKVIPVTKTADGIKFHGGDLLYSLWPWSNKKLGLNKILKVAQQTTAQGPNMQNCVYVF